MSSNDLLGTAHKRVRRAWSRNDDGLLIEYVQKYGEEWTKILTETNGRWDHNWSTSDLRLHWQKVLLKRLTKSQVQVIRPPSNTIIVKTEKM